MSDARREARRTKRSFREASRRIGRFRRQFDGAPGVATRQVAEEVKTDVAASRPGKGVPRDQGVLASTLRAEGPRKDDSALVSVGGAAAPYAIVQHERLDFHHDLGEARYLVRGLERWDIGRSKVLPKLQAEAIKAVRKAGGG